MSAGLALAVLQWGHAFSDVEITSHALPTLFQSLLQWGHAFSDVEIIFVLGCAQFVFA